MRRSMSGQGRDALILLGQFIHMARLEKGWRSIDLAERAGISRGLLHRIEAGDPACSIGSVFDVAVVLDMQLFESDAAGLSSRIAANTSILALMPRAIRGRLPVAIDDDF